MNTAQTVNTAETNKIIISARLSTLRVDMDKLNNEILLEDKHTNKWYRLTVKRDKLMNLINVNEAVYAALLGEQ